MIKQLATALMASLLLASGVAAESPATDDPAIAISGRIHFNINVSDFERSRAFYSALGFVDSIGYPPTNTLEVAQAMGIDHVYLLRAELLFQRSLSGGFIDLIEWTNPRNLDPPYPDLFRLGIISAQVLSADFDADVARLREQGIEILGEPSRWPDGGRFAFFKDPDGTFLELGEGVSDRATGRVTEPGLAATVGLGKISVNVSDLDRSCAFYQMLGFVTETSVIDHGGVAGIAAALGVNPDYAFRRLHMRHPSDGTALELTQWSNPFSDQPPFPAPINHLGIHRIAYATNDLEGDIEKLKDRGVTFVSERAPCCEGPDSPHGIVVFEDPDGVFFELVDTPEDYWEQVKAAFGGENREARGDE